MDMVLVAPLLDPDVFVAALTNGSGLDTFLRERTGSSSNDSAR